MRRFAILTLALLLVLPAGTQDVLPVRRKQAVAAAGGGAECSTPASPLLLETFEGTGYSASGWSEAGTGTIDTDYATAPAPLVDSQSMLITTASNQPRHIINSHTAGGDIYYRFKFSIAAYPSDEVNLISALTAGEAQEGALKMATDGTLRVQHGAAIHSTSTTDAIPLNTTCTIWYRHAKGTGINGVGTASFDTTGCVRPTSGNKFTTTIVGTATANVAVVDLGMNVFLGVNTGIFDQLVVDDAAID